MAVDSLCRAANEVATSDGVRTVSLVARSVVEHGARDADTVDA